MAIYLSMQRVRFSSPDGYEKFKGNCSPGVCISLKSP